MTACPQCSTLHMRRVDNLVWWCGRCGWWYFVSRALREDQIQDHQKMVRDDVNKRAGALAEDTGQRGDEWDQCQCV